MLCQATFCCKRWSRQCDFSITLKFSCRYRRQLILRNIEVDERLWLSEVKTKTTKFYFNTSLRTYVPMFTSFSPFNFSAKLNMYSFMDIMLSLYSIQQSDYGFHNKQ